MSPFEKKLVAVLNKNIETGPLMNALAHMCIGFGAHLGKSELHLMDYIDKDQMVYPNISKMPFIILKASGNKIRELVEKVKSHDMEFSAFTDTMTEGTWEEQEKRTLNCPTENLIFFGAVIYGDWPLVHEWTRKFSLWK